MRLCREEFDSRAESGRADNLFDLRARWSVAGDQQIDFGKLRCDQAKACDERVDRLVTQIQAGGGEDEGPLASIWFRSQGGREVDTAAYYLAAIRFGRELLELLLHCCRLKGQRIRGAERIFSQCCYPFRIRAGRKCLGQVKTQDQRKICAPAGLDYSRKAIAQPAMYVEHIRVPSF